MAVGVLFLAALGAVAAWKHDAIRLRYLRFSLARVSPEEVKRRVATFDRPTLELLAFDSEVADAATKRYRQPALDAIKEREKEPSSDLVLRALRDARGLERSWVFHATWPVTDEFLDAAVLSMIDEGSLEACEFVRFKGGAARLPDLRRVAGAAAQEPLRFAAVGALGATRDAKDVPVLRGALGDPSERVRIAAAGTLITRYDDRSGAHVLVDALHGDLPARAADMLGRAREKRALVELATLFDRRRIGLGALQEITGVELPPGESWPAWVQAHAAELPPQLSASSGRARAR